MSPVPRLVAADGHDRVDWLLLALTLLAYMLLTQGVNTWLIRRAWV